jgi:hypothetical protein
MWTLLGRFARAVSDVTVGTAIVLAHAALADRTRRLLPMQHAMADGTRSWRTQISP